MGGKIGVMVEVNCETDFVAKTEDFQTMARDIAMHIAASNPLYVRPEEIPEAAMEREKEIYRSQLREEKKPEKIWDMIIEGKLKKYYGGNAGQQYDCENRREYYNPSFCPFSAR